MSNNDAMARFLFAILQQKSLKDIDWNEVARSPFLAQEITNGHAARMRYSRFKASIIGHEPQKRNRATKEKPNRVTKSKKEPRDVRAKKDENIRSEAIADAAKVVTSTESPRSRIKEESVPPSYDNRLTPATVAPTPTPSTDHVIQPRLLTPCSDTDAYASARALTASPVSSILNSQASFDFQAHPFSHDPASWSQGQMFTAFEPHYHPFDGTPMGFGHQNLHPHHDLGFPLAPQTMRDADEEHADVKHEHWDNHHIQ